jgi:hypothetical protein
MKLLLQLAIGWHQELLSVSYEHHSRLASRYGYDYLVLSSRTTDRGIYWEKPLGIYRNIDKYASIAYLDADALWLKDELYVPSTAIGAVLHSDPISHYNTGVLYVNCSLAKPLIEQWLVTDDDGHLWQDQYALLKILKPSDVTILGPEYNSLAYSATLSHPDPKVVAWHGRNDLALAGMKEYLDRNRYST